MQPDASAPPVVERLREILTGRVCILGVGNALRSDDGAGPRLIAEIKGRTGVVCLDGGSAPENFLEKIVATRPEAILLLDAVNFGGEHGDCSLFDATSVATGGISTHALSLATTCDYLKARTPARVWLLGIQPQSTALGEELSPPVAATVKRLARALIEVCPPPTA